MGIVDTSERSVSAGEAPVYDATTEWLTSSRLMQELFDPFLRYR